MKKFISWIISRFVKTSVIKDTHNNRKKTHSRIIQRVITPDGKTKIIRHS